MRKTRTKPVMNVTPLVDVVLVLLIIFMIVIPNMEQAAKVELPGITNPDKDPESKTDPVTLSVTKENKLFIENQEMDEVRFLKTLEQMHKADPRRRVLLRGDRDSEYGSVQRIFRMCQEMGFPGVSLKVGTRVAS